MGHKNLDFGLPSSVPSTVADSCMCMHVCACTHTRFSIALVLKIHSPSSDAVVNAGQQYHIGFVTFLWKRLGNRSIQFCREILKAGWTLLCCQLWHMTEISLYKYLALQWESSQKPEFPGKHPTGIYPSPTPFSHPSTSVSAFLIPGDWMHLLNVAALFTTYRKEFYTLDSMHTTDTAAQ